MNIYRAVSNMNTAGHTRQFYLIYLYYIYIIVGGLVHWCIITVGHKVSLQNLFIFRPAISVYLFTNCNPSNCGIRDQYLSIPIHHDTCQSSHLVAAHSVTWHHAYLLACLPTHCVYALIRLFIPHLRKPNVTDVRSRRDLLQQSQHSCIQLQSCESKVDFSCFS